jgi:hypothetical protein
MRLLPLKTFGLLAAGLILSGSSARASMSFSFDPDGAGSQPAVTMATFDQQPGNALAVGVIDTAGHLITGTPFTLLYQATSNVLLDSMGGIVRTYGSNAGQVHGQLTVVASFKEVASGSGLTGATFSTDTNQSSSFFKIYFSTTPNLASNLAGTGFTAGHLIYQGSVLRNGTGTFNVDPTINPATTPLDVHGANNYPAIHSVTGAGGSLVNVLTTFFDPAFFKTNITNAILTFDTQDNAPFRAVDPSVKMFDGTAAATTGSLGSINGAPGATSSKKNFLFAADAASTLSIVPEPGTVVGAFAGLTILAGFGWKRRKAANA